MTGSECPNRCCDTYSVYFVSLTHELSPVVNSMAHRAVCLVRQGLADQRACLPLALLHPAYGIQFWGPP